MLEPTSVTLNICSSRLRSFTLAVGVVVPIGFKRWLHRLQRCRIQVFSHKRLFGIIPNYRTATFPHPYVPISVGENVQANLPGRFRLRHLRPRGGICKWSPAYQRQTVRSGKALSATLNTWVRLGQVLITHHDDGRAQLNVPELAGNATSVAISNVYYVDNRLATPTSIRWSTQIPYRRGLQYPEGVLA
jgi:hypothetical protein